MTKIIKLLRDGLTRVKLNSGCFLSVAALRGAFVCAHCGGVLEEFEDDVHCPRCGGQDIIHRATLRQQQIDDVEFMNALPRDLQHQATLARMQMSDEDLEDAESALW